MPKHTLKLQKWSERLLQHGVMKANLAYAVERALGGNRGNVWSASKAQISLNDSSAQHCYTATINFTRVGRAVSEEVEQRQFERIKEIAQDAVRSKGWLLEGAKKQTKNDAPETGTVESDEPKQDYANVKANQINTDIGGHFSHLFNLDAQIQLLMSAVNEYVESDFANRFHSVLWGAPACGKSEILKSLTKMVGPDAAMHFDATSTTAAGAKQLLLEGKYIPPILCIEEIEKADEASLRWLLSVTDYRSEVRSLKFRTGLVSKEVKVLCLATVNDMALFGRMMDGALASRFSNKIYCPRPSRETLHLILTREIEKRKGKLEWIDPALDYCLDVEGTNDPRRIITVCLCGKDDLLNNQYQELLKRTQPPSPPSLDMKTGKA